MKVKVSNMAECKDCIHYSRCYEFYEAAGFFFDYEKSCCKHFSKRSEWVHLPCNVGDTVYQIDAERVYESKIRNIIYDTDSVAFDERAIGKSIFLLREEAEKAIEERKKNEGI